MAIELKDKVNCNGWTLVSPKRLICETAKNIHIVEVRIDTNGNIVHWSDSTFCELDLIDAKKHIKDCIFINTTKGETALRSKIANLQNMGYEVCGTCAGHLYADCVA